LPQKGYQMSHDAQPVTDSREHQKNGEQKATEAKPSVQPITEQVQGYRSARALIGWMTPDEAKLCLSRRKADEKERPEYEERSASARAAVSSRPISNAQAEVISAAPDKLAEHIKSLQQHPSSAQYFHEGWHVAMVDLSKVCSIQPVIHKDQAVERIVGVNSDDIESLAKLSLPIPAPSNLAVQFIPDKQSWLFSSPNPNLRIMGQFGGEVQPGLHGFGFIVAVSSSYMQVGSYKGRYLLRDGYHRAYGFLSTGISHVPVFVREFVTFNEFATGLPVGLLPQDAYLGDRPPWLIDYFNDDVSAEVLTPATHKMVVIQGLELSTLS